MVAHPLRTAFLAAFLALFLAASAGVALAQVPDSSKNPDPQKPPTIIVPPQPAQPPAPPPASRREEPRADFCCTPYGRFGPVGGGRPGAPCQWTLPSGVTSGSTCN